MEKIFLDEFEQDIEDNFENLKSSDNVQEKVALLKKAATNHTKKVINTQSLFSPSKVSVAYS